MSGFDEGAACVCLLCASETITRGSLFECKLLQLIDDIQTIFCDQQLTHRLMRETSIPQMLCVSLLNAMGRTERDHRTSEPLVNMSASLLRTQLDFARENCECTAEAVDHLMGEYIGVLARQYEAMRFQCFAETASFSFVYCLLDTAMRDTSLELCLTQPVKGVKRESLLVTLAQEGLVIGVRCIQAARLLLRATMLITKQRFDSFLGGPQKCISKLVALAAACSHLETRCEIVSNCAELTARCDQKQRKSLITSSFFKCLCDTLKTILLSPSLSGQRASCRLVLMLCPEICSTVQGTGGLCEYFFQLLLNKRTDVHKPPLRSLVVNVLVELVKADPSGFAAHLRYGSQILLDAARDCAHCTALGGDGAMPVYLLEIVLHSVVCLKQLIDQGHAGCILSCLDQVQTRLFEQKTPDQDMCCLLLKCYEALGGGKQCHFHPQPLNK